MKNTIVFNFEGLVYFYDGKKEEMVISQEIFEKIEKLKRKFNIVIITNFSRDNLDKIFSDSGKISSIDKIYFLTELPFSGRIQIFDKIKKDFSSEIRRYYFGEVFPFMDYEDIKNFTYNVNFRKNIKPLKNDIKDSLISFDLDGVINDVSRFHYELFKIEKNLLEKEVGKNLSADEFIEFFKNMGEEKKKDLRKKSLTEYQKNEKVVSWIKPYLDKVYHSNRLVLFSVTSKKRINYFLKKGGISEYFSRIYSSKDDYGVKIKNPYMFKKIKNDWRNYENFVHIGDQYKSDYLSSKKAGFTPYIVDNSPYNKIEIENIGE